MRNEIRKNLSLLHLVKNEPLSVDFDVEIYDFSTLAYTLRTCNYADC